MAIYEFFGLPGSGKTTLVTHFALDNLRTKKYKYVYCNVPICVPGVIYIENDIVGHYLLEDALILIDEAILFSNKRLYKNFDESQLEYFVKHRHFNVDLYLFTQVNGSSDKFIRCITDNCYYIYKNKLLPNTTFYYKIPYGIIIPDYKKTGNTLNLGEITQGYCKPNPIVSLFTTKRLYRPLYYDYFDSWERYYLPPLPDTYKPYQFSEQDSSYFRFKNFNRVFISLFRVYSPKFFLKNKEFKTISPHVFPIRVNGQIVSQEELETSPEEENNAQNFFNQTFSF